MSISPPNPLILDYQGVDFQHIEKTKRNAIRGLHLMSLLFIFLCFIITISCSFAFAMSRDNSGLFSIPLLIFAWAICYIVCARMIQNDSLSATLVALVVISLQALALLGFAIFMIFLIYESF
ncbi:MAG: hypothetical protein FWD53_10345, partial [Phycisphaerales bacterium]|nr:hypothetical protein [Phycisphaerales bacterium]